MNRMFIMNELLGSVIFFSSIRNFWFFIGYFYGDGLIMLQSFLNRSLQKSLKFIYISYSSIILCATIQKVFGHIVLLEIMWPIIWNEPSSVTKSFTSHCHLHNNFYNSSTNSQSMITLPIMSLRTYVYYYFRSHLFGLMTSQWYGSHYEIPIEFLYTV